MKQLRLAIIGECMVELQTKQGELKQAFGGDTLNTALYFARLTGHLDVQTSYVTALGSDPFSKQMLAAWQAEGIDTNLVQCVDGKQPGIYYIETDDEGERTFFYWRNDAAAKYMFDQPQANALFDALFGYDGVYVSGITLAILTVDGRAKLFEFLEQYKKRGGKVYFDNNYRPKLWSSPLEAQATYQKILSYVDIALLTFDDEKELYGDKDIEQCIERTGNAGVQEIIIKRGAKECLVVDGELAKFVAPKPVANVVDTTAAGDSFSAGFLAKRLVGGKPTDAAAAGHTVAGKVIQYQGAIIPRDAMPDLALSLS
ncbi:sugar kinase [Vibrio sp. SM6]|uniref:2-dehydro-3-deoxygluconokinase n=1 Tax=Vibrio agarilyticus TaxID=2726741 RepID=A0A7X8TS19_9VIBR|nr:sugar kinase [Vibrio agarilyticus]NLS13761.1 sugar kinase [Vibrio agarilyticus]